MWYSCKLKVVKDEGEQSKLQTIEVLVQANSFSEIESLLESNVGGSIKSIATLRVNEVLVDKKDDEIYYAVVYQMQPDEGKALKFLAYVPAKTIVDAAGIVMRSFFNSTMDCEIISVKKTNVFCVLGVVSEM